MIKFLYSIRDVKASWTDPLADLNDQAASRGFAYSVIHSDDMLGFSPRDFSLYKVGEFDTVTGQITSYDLPVLVMDAVDAFGKEYAE